MQPRQDHVLQVSFLLKTWIIHAAALRAENREIYFLCTNQHMPRKFLKRILPDHHSIREHKHLRFLGTLHHDPNLWHLNRFSVSGGVAVGLFTAFVPIPFQMVLAAVLAIILRVNLPIAASLVWITNPLTMPPVFFITYKLGAWLLDVKMIPIAFEPSGEWLMSKMGEIWKPFLLGSFLTGALCALVGFFAVRIIWRFHIVNRWKERRLLRQQRGC